MTKRLLPLRDPEAEWVRNSTAARRVGINAKCACGESRPQALIQKSDPKICHACKRKKDGKSVMDNHHPAGRANSPTTIPIPVNDHCAELTPAQYDWPKTTLENPTGNPLLARAACIRGFADSNVYLIQKLLLPHAEFCELLNSMLVQKLGPEWWLNTDLETWSRKG